jgi:hypothetical protein
MRKANRCFKDSHVGIVDHSEQDGNSMVAVAGSGIDKACPHSVTLQPDTVAEGLFRSFRHKRPSKHIQMGEPMSYWLAVEKRNLLRVHHPLVMTWHFGSIGGTCSSHSNEAYGLRRKPVRCSDFISRSLQDIEALFPACRGGTLISTRKCVQVRSDRVAI